ncbi:hypothetical protein OSB04_010068, partial [Centaurea solstitialis]
MHDGRKDRSQWTWDEQLKEDIADLDISKDVTSDRSSWRSRTKASRSVPKPRKVAADFNLSLHEIKGKIQKRSSKSDSTQKSTEVATKPPGRPTLKDQQMNRLIFREGGLPDGSRVSYMNHGKSLLEGHKKGRGLHCYCCNTVVSPSQFEAHAGQASRKKPYGNIFVSNGVSLREYASFLKLNCERLTKRNDVICKECSQGEDLMPCAGCPRSYHQACLPTNSSTPGIWISGKWFCPFCQKSMKSVDQPANALAAGRDSGVDDPIEQIINRCIRIVDNPNKFRSCRMCIMQSCLNNLIVYRSYDFDQDASVIGLLLFCEKEFHIGCLREHKIDDLKELPEGNWFCCVECDRIYSVLKDITSCGPEKVPDFLMDIIKKKWMESDADDFTDVDMNWIVIRGKDAFQENNLLLKEAVHIFHVSFAYISLLGTMSLMRVFNPILDKLSGSDFIPSMAYGLKMGDSDFSGVHCAMLMIGSRVITAGLFRIFGQEVAELPIVATSKPEQGKGYFQLFFNCFERMLTYLTIKKIVIPAAEDAKLLWTNKFGFSKMIPRQLSEYRQTLTSMVAFEGTSMLEKEVPEGEITFEDGVRFSLSM